jgi:hypothetical protein
LLGTLRFAQPTGAAVTGFCWLGKAQRAQQPNRLPRALLYPKRTGKIRLRIKAIPVSFGKKCTFFPTVPITLGDSKDSA